MNTNRPRHFKSLFSLSFLLCCLTAPGAVHAEDIEIYQAIFEAQGNSDGAVNNDPNVLFVLDNSLSMDDYRLIEDGVATPAVPYDPDFIYGADTANRNPNVYLYATNLAFTGVSVSPNRNVCAASLEAFEANPANPVHQDKFIQWRFRGQNGNGTNFWGWTRLYFNTGSANQVVECQADAGEHGLAEGDGEVYPGGCGYGFNTCPGFDPIFASNAAGGNVNYPYDQFDLTRVMVEGNYHEYLLENKPAVAGNCSFNDEFLVAADGTRFRCLQKFEIMKRALLNVIEGDADDPEDNGINNINLGLMRFNQNASNDSSTSGGTIIDAIAPIAARIDPDSTTNFETNRDDFVAKVNGLQFEANTPLAESMWEIYQVFSGGAPIYGEETTDVAGQNVLDPDAIDPDTGNYISPFTTNQCQGNYTVMLSDGRPTQDGDLDTEIVDKYEEVVDDPDFTGCGDTCLNEVAAIMKEDLKLNTYTIGFDLGNSEGANALRDAALAGSPNEEPMLGDGYFQADDLDSLQSVFESILSEIQTIENDSFVAPAVTVNAFNRLQSSRDLYYAVFAPAINPRWAGNLKKYRVGSSGDAAEIQDVNGNDAVSEETGFFIASAQSFWSDSPDGAFVTEGGFASELLTPRKLFASLDTATTAITPLSSTDLDTSVSAFAAAVANLDTTGAVLGVLQSLIDLLGSLLGVVPAELTENVEDIIRFSLGQDIELSQGGEITDPNKFAGDNIHSSPLVLSYGGTEEEPKEIVFTTSNQGMLHAVTARGADEEGGLVGEVGGSERWAYMPDPSLMKNLGAYYNRELGGSLEKVYGIDGEISSFVERNNDLEISTAYLFMGQRRGGNKYFGVDVSRGYEATNPVAKLWTIEGGVGDFARMGQTWAKPVVTKTRVCSGGSCPIKDVLVLGGGYDTDYDVSEKSIAELADGANTTDEDGNPVVQDTRGNAVYVVDAETGDLLWAASNSTANVSGAPTSVVIEEMDHSIPSAPVVLDIDKDGLIDIIFAVDVAGQVFRFDFNESIDLSSITVNGDRIADLQENNVSRRFYNPLDAVLLPSTDDGAKPRIALVTGSGYRARPLTEESIANRFYIIYDENLLFPPEDSDGNPDYQYIVDEDSGDKDIIRIGDIPVVNDSVALQPGSTHKYGYFVSLENGTSEKVINPTLISDFQVIGVSYTPGAVGDICSAAAGVSRVYRLDLVNGERATAVLDKPGLSAAPVLVYVEGTQEVIDANGNAGTAGNNKLDPLVVIGTEIFGPGAGGKLPTNLKSLKLGKANKKAWWEIDRGIGQD